MLNQAFEQQVRRSNRFKIASASGLSLLLIFGQTVPVYGNPTGGNVVAGSATIGGAGNTVTINQASNAAVINWQQFSIASGEATKFVVPNSASATLNRVTGGNPSAIYGTLSSNGKLFLINPSGIVVGPTGRIDTNGFIGSTLNVSNEDFLKGGDLHFAGTSDASIKNQGVIHATGGDVYLIAKQVDNNGKISAPHGNVGLAAGTDVLFQQAGDQHLFVQSTPAGAKRATGVTNAGSISAATAELKAAGGNAYALAINNSGVVNATGFKKVNGQVYLTSDGGNITNSGKIFAQTSRGNGGKIVLNGHGNSSTGTVLNSGQLVASGKASGKKGGTVEVLGNQVGITDRGIVDVSGDAGGGVVLIGGDRHGDNPAIVNADQSYLGPDAQIIADAIKTGDGGKVILWANQTTQAYGAISAKGGAISGNGGFVETSAARLDARGTVTTAAPHGTNGTWLLDPSNVTIDDLGTDSGFTSPPAFTLTTSPVFITQATLLSALQSGNVTIDASTGSGGSGIIDWLQSGHTAFDIASIPGNALTLDAPGGIFLNGISITNSGSGSLNLILNASLSGAGSVTIYQSSIVTGGGAFRASGNGYTSLIDNLSDSNGVDINASTINAQGGTILLQGAGGYNYDSGITPPLQAGSGVEIQGGSQLTTTGAGNIFLQGTYSQPGQLDLSNVSAVSIDSTNGANQIIAGAGTISISGVTSGTYGHDTYSSNVQGVNIDNGSVIKTTQTGGAVSVAGDASNAVAYDSGLGGNNPGSVGGVSFGGDSSLGTNTVVSVVGGGSILITGNAGTIHTNSTQLEPFSTGGSTGVGLNDGTQITATGNSTITISGAGGTVAVDSGNIETNSFGVVIFNEGQTSALTTTVSTASGNLAIQGAGGNSPNLGVGVLIGGAAAPGGFGQGNTTVKSTTGAIQIIGDGGAGNSGPGGFTGFWTPNNGITVINNATISTSGALIFTGGIDTTTAGANALGVQVGVIADPNFDTSPVLPTLNAGSLLVNAASGSGINVLATVNAPSITLTAPSGLAGTNNINFSGPISTSLLTVLAGSNANVGDNPFDGSYYFETNNPFYNTTYTSAISNLGAVTISGALSLYTDANLTVTNPLSLNNYVLIDTTANLTANQSISAVGELGLYASGNLIVGGAMSVTADPSNGYAYDDFYGGGGILIGSTVSATGSPTSGGAYVDAYSGGNLVLGPGARLTQTGLSGGINLLAGNFYNEFPGAVGDFINNSTADAHALQLSSGSPYFIGSTDSAGTVLGGLTPDFTIYDYNTYYNNGGTIPPGNGVVYLSAGPPPGPPTPPSPPNEPGNGGQIGALSGSGTDPNQFLSTVTTQSNQIAPQQPIPGYQAGSKLVPVNFTGNGIFTQVGGTGGDLANSSSNGGSISPGDAAQLAHGELNNIANPAAANALDQALSSGVRSSLANALSSFADNDSPSHGKAVTDNGDTSSPSDGKKSTKKKSVVENSKEKTLDGGEVAVIGGNGVQNIPLSQAPPQLQNVLNDNGLAGLAAGPGH